MNYPISHFNGKRTADELVIYNKGAKTETNKYGFEACVDRNGIVISLGGNNNTIPDGGFVISAHGKAALFLADVLCLGANVEIDADIQIIIRINKSAQHENAQRQIQLIQSRVDILESNNQSYNKEKTALLLKEAEIALLQEKFEDIRKITEEAYYLTSISLTEETRAVWHRPLEKNENEVVETVKRLSNSRFNLLLIETNYGGYANALKCVHDYLPARSNFDVIDAFIRICKEYNIQIHAWYENYFIGHTDAECAMLKAHPDWIAKRKDGSILVDGEDRFYFLNPALPQVREHLCQQCRELLDNYDFDGIQLDYIRYPLIKDIDHAAGFDDYTKKAFLSETGIDIEDIQNTQQKEWIQFTEWCAKQVTLYVEMIHSLVSEYKEKGRSIQLTTAVIGNPDDAIHKKCQDWRFWVNNQWLDAIYPMAYYNDASEVEKEVSHMVENYGHTPNISGISPLYNNLPNIEATKQVEACRTAGAKGVAFFAAESFTDECLETLKKGVFRNR